MDKQNPVKRTVPNQVADQTSNQWLLWLSSGNTLNNALETVSQQLTTNLHVSMSVVQQRYFKSLVIRAAQ